MKSMADLAAQLESERVRQQITYEELGQRAGLSRLSTARVLHGETAARVTTVMALASQLGLEFVLVPKQVAPALAPQQENKLRPLTRVEQLKHGTTASFVAVNPDGADVAGSGAWSGPPVPSGKRTR